MAASVIFTVPMIALFFMFQRYLMEGITPTEIERWGQARVVTPDLQSDPDSGVKRLSLPELAKSASARAMSTPTSKLET